MDRLSYYHAGHSLQDSSLLVKECYGISVSPTTLSRWLSNYKALCTYARLRESGTALFPPHQVIQTTRLHHRQVYHYRLHKAKLALLLAEREHHAFASLETYLTDMVTAGPHRLFRDENGRGSDLKVQFDIDGVSIQEKQNLATRITQLAVQGAVQNRQRHDIVQKFMVSNDSVTVAAEGPVYLFPEDIEHFKSKLGFHIPLDYDATFTGHIDALQLRNGAIHILDYKPNARHEKPVEQLTSTHSLFGGAPGCGFTISNAHGSTRNTT